MAAVGYEHIQFLERTFVQKLGDTFAGCVFASFVLLGDSLFAAAQTGLFALGYQFLYFFKLTAHLCLLYGFCELADYFLRGSSQSSTRVPTVDLG